jgi:hypothetical protein
MPQETELQLAEANVLQAEIHVARQQSVIALKRRQLQPTALSERILLTLEVSLALHRENLSQLRRA